MTQADEGRIARVLSLRRARWDGAMWASGGVVICWEHRQVKSRCSSQDEQGPPLSGEVPEGAGGLQETCWVSQE